MSEALREEDRLTRLLRDGVEDGRTRLIICLGNLFQRDV